MELYVCEGGDVKRMMKRMGIPHRNVGNLYI